jgi:adenine-specific DNA-methyltransferase
MARPKKDNTNAPSKKIEAFKHDADKRKNIPTAELQSVVTKEDLKPKPVKYPRNTDLDPQLMWRGKDEQDWSDLVVHAPPLYIQEKVHPKVLVDDLKRQTQAAEIAKKILSGKPGAPEEQLNLFADFNGIPEGVDKTDFYKHDQHWSNRMILGDSLQVMASLAEREALRGKVQCIYFDPPYGIKFNSNFQWSTTSNKVTDGKIGHITREPEQVKAFRDTWRDGIHTYLTYLRDRLTVARDLLSDFGSIFVQISDENLHRVRALMDEVFGETNFCSLIAFETTTGQTSTYLAQNNDFLLWYGKDASKTKFRQLSRPKLAGQEGGTGYRFVQCPNLTEKAFEGDIAPGDRVFMKGDATSQRQGRPSGEGSAMHFPVVCSGQKFTPRGGRGWSTTETGMERLNKADRLMPNGINLAYRRFLEDSPVIPIVASWRDTGSGFMSDKVYVVQTNTKVIERCLLMTTDPGDLVLDPTCGSGTTAYVAEQWGRRWITIDTSRVALALARARIMGARYPYYLLADSKEGQAKEGEVTLKAPSTKPAYGNLKHGFVYERVPHITLKSIANNAEIDVIWDTWQQKLEPLREQLNTALKQKWQEWEIPRDADPKWSDAAKKLHADWWHARIARQQQIDKSIAARAEYEFLYDKPYEDKKKVRVAGPFTVESLSPHRTLGVDENDQLIDPSRKNGVDLDPRQSFDQIILENLKTAGVQQQDKADRISFSQLSPWPGNHLCAEGFYEAQGKTVRAGIFIGPEFGTVQRSDLVTAAREAADAGFDVVISCAFNYEAHAGEFNKLGKVQVLRARINADLHMAGDLKNTGAGNLFVIFGEPDIDLLRNPDNTLQVKVLGVDIFKPQSGRVESSDTDKIACWFIDTDYNEESFFVRHAYFLGQNDPYTALKTTLKAEINADAWASLNSDTSRPFEKPKSGRIAVKVINHLGDEVMKVFKI